MNKEKIRKLLASFGIPILALFVFAFIFSLDPFKGFNFYASWWAGWIMKDIQNNILQVIKQRAENE